MVSTRRHDSQQQQQKQPRLDRHDGPKVRRSRRLSNLVTASNEQPVPPEPYAKKSKSKGDKENIIPPNNNAPTHAPTRRQAARKANTAQTLSLLSLSPSLLHLIFRYVPEHERCSVLPLVCQQFAAALAVPSAAWEEITLSRYASHRNNKVNTNRNERMLGTADERLDIVGRVIPWTSKRCGPFLGTLTIEDFGHQGSCPTTSRTVDKAGNEAAAQESAKALSGMLSHVSETCHEAIRSLSIGRMGNQHIIDQDERLLSYNADLPDHLDMQHNQLGYTLSLGMLYRANIHKIKSLESLEVCNAVGMHAGDRKWLENGLAQIAETCTELKELKLRWVNPVVEEGGEMTFVQFPPSVCRMKKLQVLHLCSPSLGGEIPRELSQLSLLQDLRLEYTKFSDVDPKAFEGLVRLDYLSLRGSGPLTKVGSMWRSIQKLCLRHLDASEAHMGVLTGWGHAISSLPASDPYIVLGDLQTLDLSHTYLNGMVLTDVFVKYCPSVEKFIARNCDLTEVPKGIAEASNLKHLDLSDNFLVDLPSSLFHKGLRYSLDTLIISKNLFPALPGKLKVLEGLKYLEIDQCTYLEFSSCLTEFFYDWWNLVYISAVKRSEYQDSSKYWLQKAKWAVKITGDNGIMLGPSVRWHC